MDVSWLVCAVVALFTYLLYVLRIEPWRKYGAAMAQFPGPTPHPLLGHSLLEMAGAGEEGKILEKIQEWRIKYGSVFRVWYESTTPTVFLTDPDLIKSLLNGQNDVNNFSKGYDKEFKPFLGSSILLSYGDEWRRKRRLMSPAFYSKNLNELYPIFASAAERLVIRWKRKIAADTTFDINDLSLELKKTSLDIIGLAAFGFGFDPEGDDESDEVVEAFEYVLSAIEQRSYDFISWPNWFFCHCTSTGRKFAANVAKLQTLVFNIINKRRRDMANRLETMQLHVNGSPHEHATQRKRDLLDLLLEAKDEEGDGQGFSDKQIMEEVMTFMFAGHETTSIALSWTLYLLSQHQQVEEQLHSELLQVMSSECMVPTLADLPKLQYLDMVLSESMRLHPPQPGFVRRALRESRIGEYNIPEGAEVTVVPYLVHRDPALWPNPDLFDPERFSQVNSKARHSFAYLPFSGGLRSCIGRNFALMEARVLLAAIVRHFRVRLVEGSRVAAIPAVTLRPHGLHVTVSERPFKTPCSSDQGALSVA